MAVKIRTLLRLTILLAAMGSAQAQRSSLVIHLKSPPAQDGAKQQGECGVSDAVIAVSGLPLGRNSSIADLSDKKGKSQLDLPIGTYRVTIRRDGCKSVVIENVELHLAATATLHVRLEAGMPAEWRSLTIEETQALVNTSDATLATLVDRAQILDLPLNGRDPLQLSGLQAGVSTNTTLTQAVINGLRGSFNNITQDGVNIQDPAQRDQGFLAVTAPSVENVREFAIVTQNGAPDLGFGVSQIRLATPSGGRDWHGGAFYFHRDTVLNANSFVNNANDLGREELARHQFGARAGGSLSDRLLFFGYYEGTRENRESSVLRTVLTESARRGIFLYRNRLGGNDDCDLALTGAPPGICSVNLYSFFAADPDGARRPPSARVGAILDLVPTPNTPALGDGLNTAGFRFNSARPRDTDLWGVRLDHAKEKQRIEASFNQSELDLSKGDQETGSSSDIGEVYPGLPGGGRTALRRLGSLSWHVEATPSMANELLGGFQSSTVESFNREPFIDGTQLTIPLIDNPVQNALPEGRSSTLLQLGDQVSWDKGSHRLRFGGGLRWVRTRLTTDEGLLPALALGFGGGNPDPLRIGEALFPGDISAGDREVASDLLALLTGSRDKAQRTFNANTLQGDLTSDTRRRRFRQKFLDLYLADSYEYRTNLTFQFGLRWELHGVPRETNGLALLPVGGVAALRDARAQIALAGGGDNPIYRTDLNNFAPSLGFAWDPFRDGRTSIRGGYTLSYVLDNSLTATLGAINSNAGLTVTQTVQNLTGTLEEAGGVPQISTPQLEFPRSLPDQTALSPLNGLFTIDPDLPTPYVQQWTLGISRQFGNTAFEVRYVGNHGVKLSRAFDVNQPDIFHNGFLEDFQRAQLNLLQTGNPILGLPLTIFPLLADRGTTLLYNPAAQELLRRGEVGELLAFMLANRTTVFGGNPSPECAVDASAVGVPARIGPDFFFPNCNAFFADVLAGVSFSKYHALQAEARRRFSGGLAFQVNYTFGKTLTDFSGTIDNFAPLSDPGRLDLDVRRASFDVTHVFNANFIYALPFGVKTRLLSKGWTGGLLSDWQLSGILRWQSGPPVSLVSGRATRASAVNSLNNPANSSLTRSQLAAATGEHRLADGTAVLFAPVLFGPDGLANPAVFSNPAAGQRGALGLTPVTGPGFFNFDLSLMKRQRLGEGLELEFRVEAFNVFNNVNWRLRQNRLGDIQENINDTNFGRLVDTFNPRLLQLALKISF